MESITITITQQNQPAQSMGLAVCIEGDKTGFVSKAAVDKFKTSIKSNPEYNLEELTSKYVKPEFEIVQGPRTQNEIKFTIQEKPKPNPIVTKQKQVSQTQSSDVRERLRAKINEKYNERTSSTTKETKYTTGQANSSDMIKDVMKLIQEKRPAHRIIDVTNILNPDTYVEYQKANYFTNIAMVAERIESNEKVFAPRSNSEKSNVMVMYQGSYRTFNYDLANLVLDSVVEIIKTN
jgi:hypothetical protein